MAKNCDKCKRLRRRIRAQKAALAGLREDRDVWRKAAKDAG